LTNGTAREVAHPGILTFLHCGGLRLPMSALGQEPPRRSLAAVTALHPIPAAPSRAWGGG